MSDNYLALLVKAVNEGAPERRVMLTVRGLIIIGTLTPVAAYQDSLRGNGLGDIVAGVEAVLAELRAEAAEAPRVGDDWPSGINLRDVTISGREGLLPYWRGQIESVDGFALLPEGDGRLLY